MKKLKVNEEEYQGFKVGDICTHPTFGKCKVTMFDKARGLIQVKWPENSSSQAHWSLVEPETLKKSENMKTLANNLIKICKNLREEKEYKYSQLSPAAKKVAQKDYIDGWLETHPKDKSWVDNEWADDMLKDTEDDVVYNVKGEIINWEKLSFKKNEDNSSKKLDAILSYVNDAEDNKLADALQNEMGKLTSMYDTSSISTSDLAEIFDAGKRRSSSYSIDGNIMWVCVDEPALVSSIQIVARNFKLPTPRF